MIEEFKDVAKHFGYKIKEVKVKEREPKVCRKCGQPMIQIEGTNVWVCTAPKCKCFISGIVKKPKYKTVK